VKRRSYSDQIIIRYLLNDLHAEAEMRFEEAYLEDGDLFEQVQALEVELIDDYVNGYLSDYERQRFERHYLTSEARRARIETARQLVQLCFSSSSSRDAVPASSGSEGWWSSLLSPLRLLMKQPLAQGFGLATAILLVLGSGLVIEVLRLRGQLSEVNEERAELVRRADEVERQLALERRRPADDNTQRPAPSEKLRDVEGKQYPLAERFQPQASKGQTVFLALMPGSRDIKRPSTAVISTRTNSLELRIDLEGQETSNLGPYRIVLRAVDEDKQIWAQEGIKPRRSRSTQYLVIRVPADRFRAAGGQGFMLTLSARTTGSDRYEELDSSYFEVTSR
jgi:hypothetical protein